MPEDLPEPTARYVGGAGAGPRAGEHVVAPKNRWARAILGFRDLVPEAWYTLDVTLSWDEDEQAAAAFDFALVGFDFMARDGSSLDVESVPGLVRTLPDPLGAWLPGPAYHATTGLSAEWRCGFRMPAQASDLALGFRSWRNTAPFRISGVRLRSVEAPSLPSPWPRLRLGARPLMVEQDLVAGVGLVLRGQIVSDRPDEHAAYAAIRYRDASGGEMPLPYPDTVSVMGHGASVNLPAKPQARRFTLSLTPPIGATRVEIGLRTWEEADEAPPAVELVAPPDISLEDSFRLENLSEDDLLDGPAFLSRLANRLGLEPGAEAAWLPDAQAVPAPAILARARHLRQGAERSSAGPDGRIVLRLAGLPDWTQPDGSSWREDPFRSVPWRLDYHSLAWIPALGEAGPALAAAWAAANPWGQPSDPLSLHPAALSARAEVLARLAAGPLPEGADDALRATLVGIATQHGFALAEIVGQNAFGRSLHGLQAATALSVIARSLPRLPLAPFWIALASRRLGETFGALLATDGNFADPVLQRRLDLLSLGRALAEALGGQAPGPDITARVEAGLAGLPGLLDPGGRLPPFGDAPPAGDEAAWIGRLLAGRGSDLAAAREAVPSTLAGGVFHDTLTMSADSIGRGAGHFACTFAAPSPLGHADCTSFILAAEGRRWIVEAGGSESAETGPSRHYLVSARAHNVALLDGREPVAGPVWLAGSLRLDGASAHRIETRIHGPDVAHARTFVLLDDLDGIAVIDRFEGRGLLSVEGVLHVAPDTLVALAGPRRALAQQGARRLGFTPWVVAGRQAGLEIVNGRDERASTLQGFVATPRGLTPASTLSYRYVGDGLVCGGMMLATDTTVEERLSRLLAGEALRSFLAD